MFGQFQATSRIGWPGFREFNRVSKTVCQGRSCTDSRLHLWIFTAILSFALGLSETAKAAWSGSGLATKLVLKCLESYPSTHLKVEMMLGVMKYDEIKYIPRHVSCVCIGASALLDIRNSRCASVGPVALQRQGCINHSQQDWNYSKYWITRR